MFVLNWPVILMSTVILYVLIVVTLPFNAIYATIFLFTLIGFWSRLPGSGVNDPTWILYCLDLIDLFALIIAINIGGVAGGIFVLFANTLPRFAGFYPMWISVLYDSGSQFITCLIIPFVHVMTGGNIFITMMWYTTIRVLICMPLSFFLYPRPFIRWAVEWTTSLFGIYFANGLYAKLFGGHFDRLMEKGAAFDWLLFFIATIVILVFAITVFGFSPKKTGKKIVKVVRKVIRKVKSREIADDMDHMKKIKEQLNKK